MKKHISLLFLFVVLATTGISQNSKFFASLAKLPLRVVIEGESNSGGVAAISQTNPSYAGLQTSVKILNLNTLTSFDDLAIGGIGENNLLDHAGLVGGYQFNFGFELELARRAKLGGFYTNPVYLIKCGQGGSVISQWNTGGAYDIKALQRYNAAVQYLPVQNYKTVILYSLGINDAIAGTDVTTWKAAVIARFAVLRSRWGANTPIVMTQFQGMGTTPTAYDAYSAAVADIAATQPNVYSVTTAGATLNADHNHWDGYDTGMRFVTGKMLDVVENLIFR